MRPACERAEAVVKGIGGTIVAGRGEGQAFEVGGVVRGGDAPDVGIYRYRPVLVERKQAHAVGDFGADSKERA